MLQTYISGSDLTGHLPWCLSKFCVHLNNCNPGHNSNFLSTYFSVLSRVPCFHLSVFSWLYISTGMRGDLPVSPANAQTLRHTWENWELFERRKNRICFPLFFFFLINFAVTTSNTTLGSQIRMWFKSSTSCLCLPQTIYVAWLE